MRRSRPEGKRRSGREQARRVRPALRRQGGFQKDAVGSPSPVRDWESLASRDIGIEVVTLLSDTLVATVHAYADDESGVEAADRVIFTLRVNEVW